jgi:hypothetical protein
VPLSINMCKRLAGVRGARGAANMCVTSRGIFYLMTQNFGGLQTLGGNFVAFEDYPRLTKFYYNSLGGWEGHKVENVPVLQTILTIQRIGVKLRHVIRARLREFKSVSKSQTSCPVKQQAMKWI